jgi:hypothetical protein
MTAAFNIRLPLSAVLDAWDRARDLPPEQRTEALRLADEHARTHAPRKADAMKPMETIDERRS